MNIIIKNIIKKPKMKIIIYFRKKMLIVIIKNRERIDEFKINLL
jgi:hypothetical protein